MNSRQLQYAVQLSQTRNFSQVAEQQNISQPALSKQILNLEKELGIRLFDRDTVPLTVTPAGEYFVIQAQELLFKEEQLLRTMERFRSGEIGRIDIGISQFRGLYMMPNMIRKLQQKYPGVQVSLHEAGSDQRRKNVAEGKYDFAIVNLPVDDAILDVTPLEADVLVLAVPNTLLSKLDTIPDVFLGKIDFSTCKNIPFVTVSQTQELRKIFDQLCTKTRVKPFISAEVYSVTTAWEMVQAGLGATLLPLQFIGREDFGSKVTLFTINDHTFTRQPAIVTRKGQYLPEYARFAIKLLTSNTLND